MWKNLRYRDSLMRIPPADKGRLASYSFSNYIY